MNSATPRQSTAVDAIATDFYEKTVQNSPLYATYLGVPVRQDELDDLSPAGLAEDSTLRRETLAALAEVEPVDDVDEVTVAAMRERLGLQEELYASGEEQRTLNVIASPMQVFRDVFDLMPTATDDDWATIARRMANLPRAIDQWCESLTDSASKGHVSARRQVEACIKQCTDLTADDGYFAALLERARTDQGELAEPTTDLLREGVTKAAGAYRDLGVLLRERLLPLAPEEDAVGIERYALHSRDFLGATIDLEET